MTSSGVPLILAIVCNCHNPWNEKIRFLEKNQYKENSIKNNENHVLQSIKGHISGFEHWKHVDLWIIGDGDEFGMEIFQRPTDGHMLHGTIMGHEYPLVN